MIKNSQQIRNLRVITQSDKKESRKIPQLTLHLKVKYWLFPPKIGNKARISDFSSSNHIAIEILASAIKQEKEIRGVWIGGRSKIHRQHDYIENPKEATKRLLG